MTSWPRATATLDRADLVVVGAGIVGLAHALHAVELGLSVVVVERDSRAVGASVRNFGHACVTSQTGDALRYATRSREIWVDVAKRAGFWLRECGAVVVARSEAELAVLADLADERGDDVVLLDRGEVGRRTPCTADVVGGAFLPADLRVDQRVAVGALAAWLAEQGVRFHWSTSLLAVDGDGVTTSRGRVDAPRTVVAIGHDVDRLFPQLAAEHGVERCTLHMLSVGGVSSRPVDPAVLTGWSMLRYPAYAVSPALERVREELTADVPAGVDHALNLMFTERPDGDLVVGDTHGYGLTAEPFQDEDLDDLVLTQFARLVGTRDLRVRSRWQGIYASAPEPFLVAAPAPGVRVVSVTSGIGMTTAFGLGQEVLDALVG